MLHLNKVITKKAEVTGGGAQAPCVRLGQARLCPEEVVGGGQLRHVLNDDGTIATDTTQLEEYLSRQADECQLIGSS